MLCELYKSGCSLGLYGGRPSPGLCAGCSHWQGPRPASRPAPPPPPPAIADFFDGVYVINLRRRSDRLGAFRQRVFEAQWPFRQPEVLEGVDGQLLTPPASWGDNTKGAWGISLSHQAVLRQCLERKQQSVLVMEDDAIFEPGFAAKASAWLAQLPNDWDGLMLGGQHCVTPLAVNAQTLQCRAAVCMHGYALRGPLIADLLQYLGQTQNYQCDWSFAELQSRYNVYSPTRFLIGQASDVSDNTGAVTAEHWWQPEKPFRRRLALASLKLRHTAILAPDSLREARSQCCASCPQAEMDAAGKLTRCKACGCSGGWVISQMGTLRDSAQCALGRWPALQLKSSSP